VAVAVGEQGAAAVEEGAAAALVAVAEAEEGEYPMTTTRWKLPTGGKATGTAVEGGTAAGEVLAAAKVADLAAAEVATEAEEEDGADGDKDADSLKQQILIFSIFSFNFSSLSPNCILFPNLL
jgi:hypothetical protein